MDLDIKNEHTLKPIIAKDVMGKDIRYFHLMLDGTEKFCGYQNPSIIQPKFHGAQPIIFRPPCTSLCANFTITKRQKKDEKGLPSDEREDIVILSCGAGISHKLTNITEEKK